MGKVFLYVLLAAVIIGVAVSIFSPTLLPWNRPVTIESVVVEFWYSNDGGETYFQGDGYHSGWDSSFFMKLRVQVHTDSNKPIFPSVTLQIGEIDNITSRIIGGPNVNPTSYQSYTIYKFETRAVNNNDNFTELFVEFIPHRPETIRMEVKFYHDGDELTDFVTHGGLNFMCMCEQLSRDIFGKYSDWSSFSLEVERLYCNCAKEYCEYCVHDFMCVCEIIEEYGEGGDSFDWLYHLCDCEN
jgi:hypothetical protein